MMLSAFLPGALSLASASKCRAFARMIRLSYQQAEECL